MSQQSATVDNNSTTEPTNTRRTPGLLKKLLGKVHASARDIGNPTSFNGVIFFNASLMDSERENSYHVELRNCVSLTESELSQVHSLINNRKKAQQRNDSPVPTRHNRRSRPLKRKANTLNPIQTTKINPENIATPNSSTLPAQSPANNDEYFDVPEQPAQPVQEQPPSNQ